MTYTDVIILIPCHSLEDFPSDVGESAAAGLLNAFAVAFHPAILHKMPQLPRWHRADDPPHPQPGQLVMIPESSVSWLPHDWVNQAREAEAVVVEGVSDRDELLQAALLPLASTGDAPLDAEFVRDCLALGTVWLSVELLTRHMRNFGNVDEIRFQNRVIGTARAVLAHDRETAQAHLQAAFEILLEAREQFYPVDSYLIDLCLLIPDVVNEEFAAQIRSTTAWNLLVSGTDLTTIAEQHPEIAADLKTAVAEQRICVLAAEQDDSSVPVLPMSSWLHHLLTGQQTFRRLLGATPNVWGRRRFGLSPVWPQILQQLGYVGALHVAIDDGIYPDAEHSRMRWQGNDGTLLEAFSRIPLAADGAATFLRAPQRLAESMDNDHVAAICFARWPEVKTPWLEDWRRSQKYAPVLGKFITFDRLFTVTASPGRISNHHAGDYFTPFLLQHVARREANPISRYADHVLRSQRFDQARWCQAMSRMLHQQPISPDDLALRQRLEAAGPDGKRDGDVGELTRDLAEYESLSARELTQTLLHGASQTPGMMILNPQRFGRRLHVPWPAGTPYPPVSGAVKAIEPGQNQHPGEVIVDVPGFGFAWLPTSGPSATPAKRSSLRPRMPNDAWTIFNERFEVTLNEATGGIGQVRHPQKRQNRFSQLVSFRYPRERQIPGGEGEPPFKSQYAETRCTGHQLIREHGAWQEFATEGEIIDQLTGQVLAQFQQRTKLDRYRPAIEIDVSLTAVVVPDGDPWNNYFCLRFAWESSSAAVTRCLVDEASEVSNDRFETTEYIEIADETERLTIIPYGLPFHRKTGPRMLDALLIVHGETRRDFHFAVAMDQTYPLEAAREATLPALIVPTESGPPRGASTGWLLHIDTRGMELLELHDLGETDSATTSPVGYVLRVLETEGRGRTARIRLFRSPIAAIKRALSGTTEYPLPLEGDAVICEFKPYELAEIELRF
ncbi:hypothetical protein GC163_05500 [bacterium]|nr:hypothetical protein [bacterium]